MFILPLNHLGNIVFPGNYTFIKGVKKSQIDYVFTNNHNNLKQYHIEKKALEVSDYKSLHCQIKGQLCLPTKAILVWAKDSNDIASNEKLKFFRMNFFVDELKLKHEVKRDMDSYVTRLTGAELLEENIMTNFVQRYNPHSRIVKHTIKLKKIAMLIGVP